MFRFILTITIIAAFIGVSSKDVKIKFLVANVIDNPSGLFYYETDYAKKNQNTKLLTFVDSDSYMEYTYDSSNRELTTTNFSEFELLNDGFTFVYKQIGNQPSYKEITNVVVGTKKTISSAEYFKGYYPIATVNVTTDDDYEICKAHADFYNHLFLAVNSKKNKNKGGRLYKFVDTKISLVKEYPNDIMDFAWKLDYTLMFLIKNSGKTIVQYDYDIEKHEISNEQTVFTLPSDQDGFGEADQMTGIETDKNSNLWVIVNNGKLLQIQSGKLKDSIDMPVKNLTGITFGHRNIQNLLISTAKDSRKYGSGSILMVSGIDNSGYADNPVKW